MADVDADLSSLHQGNINPSSEKDAKALELIEQLTEDVASVQERVLKEILSTNMETEYLRRFQLHGATDRQSFKSRIPIVEYEDILPDIQRIVSGDKSPILCVHPTLELFSSSGTSGGKSKLIPVTEENWNLGALVGQLIEALMNKHWPGLEKGKGLKFHFAMAESRTPGGLLVRPATTRIYKSEEFKNGLRDTCTSPIEAILCLDPFQSMYTQMLCGLIMRDQVLQIGSNYASVLVTAIRFLQSNWNLLATDISAGTLNPKITDPSIRERMSEILKPNPQLADFIIKQCSEDKWEGIIRRIWPYAKFLRAVVTGSMAQHIPSLEYYSAGLPLVSNFYVSSEGSFGFNMKPECRPSDISYMLLPNMAYFEFLPLDDQTYPANYLQAIDLADVEVGKEYEIVVTTYAGLYRYRVGDVLQVTGTYNSAPQFRFLKRKNVLLSLHTDKTDEAELQKAIQNASSLLQEFNTSVVDFTSYADSSAIPGHYVIYLELLVRDPENSPPKKVLEQCCLTIEDSLNHVYRRYRVADKSSTSIGPLEVRVVENGTFEEVMKYAISKGASLSQYKVPRCVSNPAIRELLDSRVISKLFSPSLPHWSPPEF